MAKARKRRQQNKKSPARQKKTSYSAGEWFMVGLGLALLIMVAGIIITAVLGG